MAADIRGISYREPNRKEEEERMVKNMKSVAIIAQCLELPTL
jgi:hypothetical protein